MPVTIYAEAQERDDRLGQLALERNDLVEAVHEYVSWRAQATDNDPKSAAGFLAWSFGVRHLRFVHIKKKSGWEKFEENGIEGIRHRTLKLKVIIARVDKGACDPDRSPRYWTPKGPATEEVIDTNLQIDLFAGTPFAPETKPTDDCQTWQLCIFDDGNTVRAELNLAIKQSLSDHLDCSERIWLIQGDEWSGLAVRAPEVDDGPDLNISVQLR